MGLRDISTSEKQCISTWTLGRKVIMLVCHNAFLLKERNAGNANKRGGGGGGGRVGYF